MMQYSALDRRPEEWLNVVASEGASVVTRGTVAKGLLTNEWEERLRRANGYNAYLAEDLTYANIGKVSCTLSRFTCTCISIQFKRTSDCLYRHWRKFTSATGKNAYRI